MGEKKKTMKTLKNQTIFKTMVTLASTKKRHKTDSFRGFKDTHFQNLKCPAQWVSMQPSLNHVRKCQDRGGNNTNIQKQNTG